MFSSLHHCLLLADRSVLRDMGSGLRDRREHFGSADLLPWVLVITILAALMLVISRFITRNDSQRLFNNSQGLFRALCQAHHLDRSEQRLLMQIAKATGVAPTTLFLSPATFARIEVIAEFVRPEAAEELAAKLFADVSPWEKSSQQSGDTQNVVESARTLLTQAAAIKVEDPLEQAPQLDANESREPAASERRDAPRSAPSLFQPAPPTIVSPLDSRGEDAVGPTRRANRSEDHSTSLTEQQAMRALEILMQQIKAERGVATPAPSPPGGAAGSYGYRADEALWQPPHSVAAGEMASIPTVF